MNSNQSSGAFSAIIGLIAILIIFLFIILGLVLLGSLEKEVAAAIGAAFVGVAGITIGKSYERKLSIEQALREKKMPLFEEFTQAWMEFLLNYTQQNKSSNQKSSSKAQPSSMDSKAQEFIAEYTPKLIVWAPDEVILLWSRLRQLSTQGTQEASTHNLFLLEELFLAMRKDVGHKNENFRRGDILRLFITDVDKIQTPQKD
ncbi:MAG: hypothetical protein H6673_07730 [Anaerolineales bacterium]|nr:hypothetical protein [Anaerolineales bacterium]